MHHYAFIQREDSPVPFYERTFGSFAAAQQWAERDPRRFIMTDSLPPRYWY